MGDRILQLPLCAGPSWSTCVSWGSDFLGSMPPLIKQLLVLSANQSGKAAPAQPPGTFCQRSTLSFLPTSHISF